MVDNINRTELIDQLKKRYGIKKKDSEIFLKCLCECIMENLQNGVTVSIMGFGTFDIILRERRSVKDPNDNVTRIEIPAHYIPKFYPSEQMKRTVRLGEDSERRKIEENG